MRRSLDRYSKPLGDVRQEAEERRRENARLLERARAVAESLRHAPPRSACVLCGTALGSVRPFTHRDLPFLTCASCGHVQTQAQPPVGYPRPSVATPGINFSQIYVPLTSEQYRSRVERIYRPKVDWILETLGALGIAGERSRAWRWREIGCGAGGFLAAARDAGIGDLRGWETAPEMLAEARRHLGAEMVEARDLTGVEDLPPADLYAAFYVLEHLERPRAFLERLSRCAPGTYFAFAVPVMGFSTLVENAFPEHAARNLDGVIHTQIYTDESIRWAMDYAGYEIVGRWVFGQDAQDLMRLLLLKIEKTLPREALIAWEERLASAEDGVQQAFDRCGLADSRHILARRRIG